MSTARPRNLKMNSICPRDTMRLNVYCFNYDQIRNRRKKSSHQSNVEQEKLIKLWRSGKFSAAFNLPVSVSDWAINKPTDFCSAKRKAWSNPLTWQHVITSQFGSNYYEIIFWSCSLSLPRCIPLFQHATSWAAFVQFSQANLKKTTDFLDILIKFPFCCHVW